MSILKTNRVIFTKFPKTNNFVFFVDIDKKLYSLEEIWGLKWAYQENEPTINSCGLEFKK